MLLMVSWFINHISCLTITISIIMYSLLGNFFFIVSHMAATNDYSSWIHLQGVYVRFVKQPIIII